MTKNYYDILGIDRSATQDDIKKAYRKLSKQYHPDKTGGDDTMFKEINEAYSVLSDTQKKHEYDNPPRNNDYFGYNQWHSYSRPRPSNIETSIEIDIHDAYFGCKKNIRLGVKVFSVDIPKGTGSGQILRMKGLGTKGYDRAGNEVTGDLFVTVRVKNTDSKIFLNQDGTLEVMTAIDWMDAILGGDSTVDVFGRNVHFRIPKYSQNGSFTIVPHQGFPKFNSDEYGILKVNFIVKMPKSLTDNQLDHIKKIKESM